MCEFSRQQAYTDLFKQLVDPEEVYLIRNTARFSMPTGDNRFITQVEQALKRKVGYAHRGRPRKTRSSG